MPAKTRTYLWPYLSKEFDTEQAARRLGPRSSGSSRKNSLRLSKATRPPLSYLIDGVVTHRASVVLYRALRADRHGGNSRRPRHPWSSPAGRRLAPVAHRVGNHAAAVLGRSRLPTIVGRYQGVCDGDGEAAEDAVEEAVDVSVAELEGLGDADLVAASFTGS